MERHVPLLSCACHSWSDFCNGYDILRDSAVEKREPRKGMGIDARSADGRAREWNGLGGVRIVVFEKAYSVRMKVGIDGKRIYGL